MRTLAAQTGRRRTTRLRHRSSAGFTLVEILITTAVTVVAFTGLASLQVLSVRAADSALERTQATALSYEMIDRLRVNRGSPGDPNTALGGAYDGESVCDQSDKCARSSAGDFSGTDMVTLGLRYWWKDANALGLSGWYAGIERSGDIFRVAVQWDDSRAEGDTSSAGTSHESCLGGELGASTQEVCVMTQL